MFIPKHKDKRYEHQQPKMLELPLPQSTLTPLPPKKKEEKTEPERGVWTIDI